MLGLTPLGTVHTAISLIALFAALWRHTATPDDPKAQPIIGAFALFLIGATLQVLRLRRPQRSLLDGAA
jgi:hypothetical protein